MISHLSACVFVSYCIFTVFSYSYNRYDYVPPDPVPYHIIREYEEERGITPHQSSRGYCVKPAKCINLTYSTCFGVMMPFTQTSLSLVYDITFPKLLLDYNSNITIAQLSFEPYRPSFNQHDIKRILHKWRNIMIKIPKCWAVVQPFLCALFMPKCENNEVVLPSKKMCDAIQHPCRILIANNLWPPEFSCSLYKQENCENDMTELEFNTSSRCVSPWVRTEFDRSYYDGMEGCTVQCLNSIFSDDEREIRYFVGIFYIIAILLNLSTMVFFLNRVHWNSYKRYRSIRILAMFFLNHCFLMESVGLFYQFGSAVDNHAFCNTNFSKNATLRLTDPEYREYSSCSSNSDVFFYLTSAEFLLSSVFSYDSVMILSAYRSGKIEYKKDKTSAYNYVAAWLLPYVLTMLIKLSEDVNGGKLLGVCVVAVINNPFHWRLLLVPLSFYIIGWFLMIKVFVVAMFLKPSRATNISSEATAKYCCSIAKTLMFSMFLVLCGLMTYKQRFYDYQHYEELKENFRSFINCKLVADDEEVCSMKDQPYVSILHVAAVFGSIIGMNMLSWGCLKSGFHVSYVLD